MPRRRRNYSRRGRGAVKKAATTPTATTAKAEPSTSERAKESPVVTKNEAVIKQAEVPEKPKVTTPVSSGSTFKVNQVPPRKRRAAFVIANDSNDATPEKRNTAFDYGDSTGKRTHLESASNTDPLKLENSNFSENLLGRKGLTSALSPATLSAVKLEKYDDCGASLNGRGEDKCNITESSIKIEEIDCGVQSLHEGEEHIQSLRVPGWFPTSSLVSEVEASFNMDLPQDWFCKSTNDGFNVMLLSSCKEKAIQRRVFFSFQGEVEISVHRKPLSRFLVDEFLKGLLRPMFLAVSSCKDFVERSLGVVHRISNMSVCRGADQDKYQNLWLRERTGVLDSNPYGEDSYVITFRSEKCKRLSISSDWPCEECVRLLTVLRGQYKSLLSQMNDGTVAMKPHMLHSGSIPQCSVPVNEITSNSGMPAALEQNFTKESKTAKAHYVTALLPGGAPDVCEEKVVPDPCNTFKKPSAEVQSENVLRVPISQLPLHMMQNPSPELQGTYSENKYSTPSVTLIMVPNTAEKAALKTYTGKEMSVSAEAALKRNQQLAQNSRYGKIKLLLEKSAVLLESELSQDLLNILKELKDLSGVQQQFIEMQKELASQNRASGMKWLPTLIRYALFMKSLSVECTGSGMITLPSGKVLFNFSQVLFRIKKEFQTANIKGILEKPYLKSSSSSDTYSVLLIDEIDVSDNLVYQKSNGELIGFVKLSDVKDEMDRIEDFIVADKCFSNRPIPSYTMLVYIVKGISNRLKEVVAVLDAEDVSAQTVYDVTWNVIGTLEQHHIKVIGVVNNGYPRTKRFLDLHTGAKLDSGQIYATKNVKANGRPLFFFTDAAYLLKQIRNCMEESGCNGVNQKILTKNKETIVWKTIEKLYFSRKWLSLESSDVFLNEYSRKKASHASAVLNSAVAVDLESRFWTSCRETATFISKVSDTFGALLSTDVVEGKVPSKPFPTYTRVDDKRFAKMLELLDYISDWKTEVDDIPIISAEDKSKLILDEEICNELEMSLKAFIDVSLFLLKEGVEEIDPNVFWLEPIGKCLEKGWFGFVQTVNSYIKRSVNFHSHTKQTSE